MVEISCKTEQVEVKFPYHRHELSGRMSNHAKLNVMANFLELWMPTHNQMDDVQKATVPSFFNPHLYRSGEKL